MKREKRTGLRPRLPARDRAFASNGTDRLLRGAALVAMPATQQRICPLLEATCELLAAHDAN